MKWIWRLGRHGLIFTLAKSVVLVAPLLAASILTSTEYGSVEWWLALSMALGPIIGLGAPSVVAYGSVNRQQYRHVRTATVCVLMLASTLLVFALALPLFGREWGHDFYGPVALQCAVIMLQMTLAARLKGTDKGAWAAVAESALYLCLLVALLGVLFGADFVMAFMLCMLVVCVLLALLLARLVAVPALRRWPSRNFRACLGIAWRYMLGAALMAGFMALPRVALGFLESPQVVASFALVFRWLSISIIAHQFINTVFFRHIYGDVPERRRDYAFALIVSVVAIGALFIVLFVGFGEAFVPFPLPFPQATDLALPMAMVMILWAATACLEGSLFREGAALKQSRSVAIGLFVQVLALSVCLMGAFDVLQGMTYAWIAGLMALIIAQFLSFEGARPTILGGTLSVWVIFFIALVIIQLGWA